jgi:predicted CopG family antitoxin
MRTKTVRLREDVYERIRARKREEETFSEAVDRLTGDPSLSELGGIFDDDQVDGMRDAIDAADEADADAVEDLLERFDDS